MPIKVSIVEDHRETREKLEELIAGEPKLRHLRSYGTGEDALSSVPSEKPDVLLVDINLPGMSGIDCVAKLTAKVPGLLVLILTTYNESKLIFDSLRVGASGYLLKKSAPTELLQAIEEVHAGGAPMSSQVARMVVTHFRAIPRPSSDVDQLTEREQTILTLLAKGSRYKEISDELGITFNTVRTHVKNIYEKLHVQSRTEATVKFLESRRSE
jgi:DNA-binding NarL/FixJ family response regulator